MAVDSGPTVPTGILQGVASYDWTGVGWVAHQGNYVTLQQSTPTVQAAAYAAGAVIGGLITLTTATRLAGGGGLIQSVAASFTSGVLPNIDVIYFNASPTGSTVTDRVAVAIVAADMAKIIGIAHLTDATLVGAVAPSYVQSGQNAMPFGIASGNAIYAAVVTRTAITLTSTTDMILSTRILQD